MEPVVQAARREEIETVSVAGEGPPHGAGRPEVAEIPGVTREYLLSLPERAVRAASAGVGGLVYEASEVALPAFVRRSRLYQATVARMLRIVVELVGGVLGVFGKEAMPARELAVRKLAGNALELAGFLAFGWSPVWLLAAAADVTNGTRAYLRVLVDELKRTGALPEGTDVGSVEQLLNVLEHTSGTAADAIDVPPLNVPELRRSLQELRHHADDLPTAERLGALFADLRAVAQQEGQSLFSVSSAVAAGAVQAGAQLGTAHVFEYYRGALGAIRTEGFPVYLRRVSRPYADAAARHLDPRTSSHTERWLLRRAAGGGRPNAAKLVAAARALLRRAGGRAPRQPKPRP